MNIHQLLQKHRAEVKRLFRKYTVIGDVSMATVEKGFNQHGEKFMLDLLAIITPDDSSFSAVAATSSVSSALDNLNLFSGKASEAELEKAVNEGGKFWGFWQKLFSTVDDAGQAIGQFKINSSGQVSSPFYQAQNPQIQAQMQLQAKNRSRLIFTAAGFLVSLVLVVIVLNLSNNK
nr:hypothetical protein [uncultured Draconibacterium sp.]